MAATKITDVYTTLDKIRTGVYKNAELAKALDYISDKYPAHYDRIIATLVEVRSVIADDILHRQLLEDESDKRQTKLNL